MYRQRLKALLTAAGIILLLTVCDDLSGAEEELDQGSLDNIDVSLVNDTALPLHIVGPDEQFGDANRVGGHAARTYRAQGLFDGQGLAFRAGIFTELWVEVGHVTCTYRDDPSNATKDDFLVIYHGVGSMTCENW
jgi:hypothetical protein